MTARPPEFVESDFFTIKLTTKNVVLESLLFHLSECFKKLNIDPEDGNDFSKKYVSYLYNDSVEFWVNLYTSDFKYIIEIVRSYGDAYTLSETVRSIRAYLSERDVIEPENRKRWGRVIQTVPPPSPAIRPEKEEEIPEMMPYDHGVTAIMMANSGYIDFKAEAFKSIANLSETEKGREFLVRHIPFLVENLCLPPLFEDCHLTKNINRCACTALANVVEHLEPGSCDVDRKEIESIVRLAKKNTTSKKMIRECDRIIQSIIL
jgi:hypothetical protein